MTVELAGGGYRVAVDPAHGGAILSAVWRNGAGDDFAVLAPQDDGLPPFKAGCFAMLPFANRIADGRFQFAGRDYELPVNLPDENMAIHGFGRNHPWKQSGHADDSVVLEQDFGDEGNPYRYHARQEIAAGAHGIRIALSVRNEGNDPMPFGIGLHPWFRKTGGTTLAFSSNGSFARDGRGLPVLPSRSIAAFDADTPSALDGFPRFDGFFQSWEPRRARIVRPEDGIAIEIAADGAFRHLHVFVPDDRPVLCAEPVSHAPDAINRPELGGANAMHVLAPGEELAGTMTIRAMPYPPVRGREE